MSPSALCNQFSDLVLATDAFWAVSLESFQMAKVTVYHSLDKEHCYDAHTFNSYWRTCSTITHVTRAKQQSGRDRRAPPQLGRDLSRHPYETKEAHFVLSTPGRGRCSQGLRWMAPYPWFEHGLWNPVLNRSSVANEHTPPNSAKRYDRKYSANHTYARHMHSKHNYKINAYTAQWVEGMSQINPAAWNMWIRRQRLSSSLCWISSETSAPQRMHFGEGRLCLASNCSCHTLALWGSPSRTLDP